MPYILNKTNGTVLVTLGDASIDRTTDLTFVGKNYAGYGEIINEDLLHLLENFASGTSPSKPITGQIWYDTKNKKLKLHNGTKFNSVPVAEVSTTSPKDLGIGDFWFNSAENRLYVKSSATAYTLIGPSNTISYINLIKVRDVNRNFHYILTHTVAGNVVAVESNDEFTINLDEQLADQFTLIQKGTTIINNGSVSAPTVVSQSLTTGAVSTAGTITGQWSLTSGSSLEATYADIAERYEADAIYEPGTVLVIGGSKEVTVTSKRANIAVAGIVSTNPAYKLNSEAGTDETHPYIALKGRIPCKVFGPIKKGDLLVTSDRPGYAIAYNEAYDNPAAIIGKALSNNDKGVGIIEVKV